MYVHTVEAPRARPHPRLRGATFSFVERGVESIGPLRGSDGFYVGVGQRGELRVVDGFTDRDLATIREDSEGSQDRMSRVDMVCPGGVGPRHSKEVFDHHQASGFAQPHRTISSLVAVQSPDPLQDQVHGRRVGEHEIEVDVEALLDDLSCDDDVTLGTARGPLPEKFEHASITRGPFGCKETRVQQGRLLAPKNGLHCVVGFLRFTNGITNNDGTSTIN